MPTLFKRSNGVYYSVFIDDRGRRRWVSTDQRLKKVALKTLCERADKPWIASEGKRVRDFFAEFSDFAKTVYTVGTCEIYDRAFNSFLRQYQ